MNIYEALEAVIDAKKARKPNLRVVLIMLTADAFFFLIKTLMFGFATLFLFAMFMNMLPQLCPLIR